MVHAMPLGAANACQVPTVAAAMADVGALYGSFLSGVRRRPVGGVLNVFRDRIVWTPGIWLGRGHAKAWEIPADRIVGFDPASSHGTSATVGLVTVDGPIVMVVADAVGLGRAVAALMEGEHP